MRRMRFVRSFTYSTREFWRVAVYNPLMDLIEYEQQALDAIHEWKSPDLGWLDKIMETVNRPINKMGDTAMSAPVIGWALDKSISGLVSLLSDAAHWSVRRKAIFKEYRKKGLGVESLEDIGRLRLHDVDRTIGFLAAKYKSLALVEAAGTGVLGVAGIPADVIGVISLNMRAIGEYATYCGFDVGSQAERLFAMNILGLSSSPSDAQKKVAMSQIVKIAKDVAQRRSWTTLEQGAFMAIIERVANSLGLRLTKAKLAQIVPIVGVGVSAGFNLYYTTKVCDAAYFLYRERFLAEKYGQDMIEATVLEAEDYEPDYEDE